MDDNAYTYAYDPIGNRTGATNGAVGLAYTANALNQYTRTDDGVTVTVPAYDPDGNMLTNGVWVYTWDAENRMVSACSNNVLLVTNVYDHMSRRIRKVSRGGAETAEFLYDGWNPIREICANASCTITNYYTWGLDLSGSMQGAGGVGGLLAVTTMGWEWDVSNSPEYFTYYPLYDANGNVVSYTENWMGGTAASFEYDAFGNAISDPVAEGLHLPIRFSTKYWDAETGLYYYGYRFYHPELGRWVSRDPLGEYASLNTVGFVDNGSLNDYDLLGLRSRYNCVGGSCRLVDGDEPAVVSLAYANKVLILKSEEFLASVAKSLKWTYNNIIESGFRIYEDGAFGKTVWSTSALARIKEFEAIFTKEEENKIERQKLKGTRREEALKRIPEIVKERLIKMSGTAVPLGPVPVSLLSKPDISNYHSHPLTKFEGPDGLGFSATDSNVLKQMNRRDGLPLDMLREAFLSRPDTSSKCATLFKYSDKSAPVSTGIEIRYR